MKDLTDLLYYFISAGNLRTINEQELSDNGFNIETINKAVSKLLIEIRNKNGYYYITPDGINFYKSIKEELEHLKNIEQSIFAILVSLLFTTLTLSVYPISNIFIKLISELGLMFTFFLLGNHLIWIILKNNFNRIKALFLDIVFFLILVIVYPTAVIVPNIISSFNINLMSSDGFLISIGFYLIIVIFFLMIIHSLIDKIIISMKNDIFPFLTIDIDLINPLSNNTNQNNKR